MEKPSESQAQLEDLKRIGVGAVYLPRARGNFDLKAVLRAYKICRQLKCDVFHCDNMHTSPLIGAWLAGTKVRIWHKRSMNSAYEKEKKENLKDKIMISVRLSCLLSTKVLAVSKAVKQELIDHGISGSKILVLMDHGISDSKILVRPNPIPEIIVNGHMREEVRNILKVSERDILFITIGRSIPVKGWDILVSAFAQVVEKLPNVKLICIGSVSRAYENRFFEYLLKEIFAEKLEKKVLFTGHIDNIEDLGNLLAAADIYVHPSRSEGFGLALLEALAAGLPCIATAVGVAPEVIQYRVNGILVERGNKKALAEAMIELGSVVKIEPPPKSKSFFPAFIPTADQHARGIADISAMLLKQTLEE